MGLLLYLCSAFLLLCLMKAQVIREECTRPNFESRSVTLKEEHFMIERFPNGYGLEVECMIGHKPTHLSASKTVTCTGNKWTDLELSCEKKSCGSPPDFYNGRYEKNNNGFLFGDTITPVCNKGYMLAGYGPNIRVCRDKGWDGRDPLCEVVKCEAPPSIVNGYLADKVLPIYDYLQVVTYKCNRGLSLVGNSLLHCSEDGTFKPEPPKCVDGCPNPEIPHAIRIGGKAPPYKRRNFATYKCEENYILIGNPQIVCTENGWNPDPPKCIEPCPSPHFEGFVVLTKDHCSQQYFPHGSTATFECACGYKPVNSTVSTSVTCQHGKWTKLPLTCKAEQMPVIKNGQIEAFAFKCNKEFLLSGSPIVLRSEDGTYKQDLPQCLPKSDDGRMGHGKKLNPEPELEPELKYGGF